MKRGCAALDKVMVKNHEREANKLSFLTSTFAIDNILCDSPQGISFFIKIFKSLQGFFYTFGCQFS